jgi:hypothetical protein
MSDDKAPQKPVLAVDAAWFLYPNIGTAVSG